MRLLLSVLLLSFSMYSFAQTVTKHSVSKAGTVKLSEAKQSWGPMLQHMEMPSPDGNSEKSKLMRLKKQLEEKYPRRITELSQLKVDSFPSLNLGMGFEGNAYNNRVPDDNTVAISNDGFLISCINSTYLFYDTEADTLMDTGFLNDFITQFNINTSKYDPKLTYDPEEDRFVLVFLTGTVYQNSKIPVCFSSTNNPTDPWYVYLLDGNALGSNHWTDYPAIALSEDELFLTGNLLENNQSWQTGFNQSIIWQMDKHAGFAGDTALPFQVWSGINHDTLKIRNIHPVKGARKLYGPNQYFVSNKNFSAESDTVYLIEISNTMANGSATLTVTHLTNPDHYFLSPSGRQSINEVLATNDSRMLGAVRDDNWIQYVHNSMDTTSGNAGVYHGTISDIDGSPIASGNILSHPIKDLGYPNIASTAINPNEKEVVIGFNYTSPVDTNGVACYYMNNDEFYSDMMILKRGEAPINILSDTAIDRWGDYFGIQRNFSEPCKVWTAGMYGKSGENGCWIGEVYVSDTCRTPDPIEDTLNPPFNSSTLFPNPSVQWATWDFEMTEAAYVYIQIFDDRGRLVRVLHEGVAQAGENRFTFDSYYLNQGVYFLRITTYDEVLFEKKLVKLKE